MAALIKTVITKVKVNFPLFFDQKLMMGKVDLK